MKIYEDTVSDSTTDSITDSAAVSASDPPSAPFVYHRLDVIFSLLAFFLGFWFVYTFSSDYFSEKMTVFTVAYAIFVLSWLYLSGRKPVKESWFYLVLLFAAGISFSFWSLFELLHFLTLYLLAAYWTLSASGALAKGTTSNWAFLDGANAFLILPFSNFACQWRIWGKELKKNSSSQKILSLLLGIGISVPVLAVVLPLLSSADTNFNNLILSVSDYIGSHFAIHIFRLLFSLPVSFCIFSLVFGSMYRRNRALPDPDRVSRLQSSLRFLTNLAVCTVLGLVCIFYCIFIALQGSYFFSAFAGIRPDGFTYAEYARQGFFELCKISAFNLLLLVFCNFCAKAAPDDHHALRIMDLFLSVLTLLLIATALSKMFLYIFAYGLTAKRILATTFLLWLGVIFTGMIIRQKKPSFSVMRIAVFSGSILLTQLHVLPWEYIIQYVNHTVFF
ncbi:MAG: DUF4173 domain-containing protein [Fusicatenibacter sp.]|nr:DUF4173 domain-containing protein [Fusicatenibacter sp.]